MRLSRNVACHPDRRFGVVAASEGEKIGAESCREGNCCRWVSRGIDRAPRDVSRLMQAARHGIAPRRRSPRDLEYRPDNARPHSIMKDCGDFPPVSEHEARVPRSAAMLLCVWGEGEGVLSLRIGRSDFEGLPAWLN